MNSSSATTVTSANSASQTRIAVAAGAFLLGLALFIAAGFASPAMLHNSTHDTRHALGLPCH